MQIEATLSHGQLEFSRPIQLKHDRVRLMVDVPDDEIVESNDTYGLPPEVLALAVQMRSRLDSVRNAPLRPDDELPLVSSRTLERIDAFAQREKR